MGTQQQFVAEAPRSLRRRIHLGLVFTLMALLFYCAYAVYSQAFTTDLRLILYLGVDVGHYVVLSVLFSGLCTAMALNNLLPPAIGALTKVWQRDAAWILAVLTTVLGVLCWLFFLGLTLLGPNLFPCAKAHPVDGYSVVVCPSGMRYESFRVYRQTAPITFELAGRGDYPDGNFPVHGWSVESRDGRLELVRGGDRLQVRELDDSGELEIPK
ncbi:hypothetical protein ACX8Z7_11780 [Glutamicibacter endophyticus]